jgi:hypothetical protein
MEMTGFVKKFSGATHHQDMMPTGKPMHCASFCRMMKSMG